MWKRVAAAALVVGSTCILAAHAQALDKTAYCRDYTNAAVGSARQNVRWKCGFDGSRYTMKRQVHFDWCMTVDREATARERDIRRDQMQACRR